jgi:cytochrome P450
VDRILGERNDITYEDITSLKYCASVFKEALRLYPPAAALWRLITEEMEIDGYKIPKNTIVQV